MTASTVKKVILSVGPIPAKLDSVKIITNKFKGGLAIKTAEELSLYENLQVEIVKWRGTEIRFHYPESYGRIPITVVEDLYDYRDYIRHASADAYILAAAIANLIPVNPWPGKFPSHNYDVDEEFDIRFRIAPHIIDEVKQNHPRSTLIGYKLFDGPENELISAGWGTLCNSKANVIFCNHPATAKREKIALMPDGTHQRMSFEQHIEFIERVINLQWYTTEICIPSQMKIDAMKCQFQSRMDILLDEIAVFKNPHTFGTVAVRDGGGFITTTRGKKCYCGQCRYCKVFAVNHTSRIITASQKATLNAPFIDKLLALYPTYFWVIHGHRQIANVNTYPYSFSGTSEETDTVIKELPLPRTETVFNVKNHGYYALFESFNDARRWLRE